MSLTETVKKIAGAPKRVYQKAEEVADSVETKAEAFRKHRQHEREESAEEEALEEYRENESKFRSGKISKKLYEKRVNEMQHNYDERIKPAHQRVAEAASGIGSTFATGYNEVSKRVAEDRGGTPGLFAFPTRSRRQAAPTYKPEKPPKKGKDVRQPMQFGQPIQLDFAHPAGKPTRQPYDLGMNFGNVFGGKRKK